MKTFEELVINAKYYRVYGFFRDETIELLDADKNKIGEVPYSDSAIYDLEEEYNIKKL